MDASLLSQALAAPSARLPASQVEKQMEQSLWHPYELPLVRGQPHLQPPKDLPEPEHPQAEPTLGKANTAPALPSSGAVRRRGSGLCQCHAALREHGRGSSIPGCSHAGSCSCSPSTDTKPLPCSSTGPSQPSRLSSISRAAAGALQAGATRIPCGSLPSWQLSFASPAAPELHLHTTSL